LKNSLPREQPLNSYLKVFSKNDEKTGHKQYVAYYVLFGIKDDGHFFVILSAAKDLCTKRFFPMLLLSQESARVRMTTRAVILRIRPMIPLTCLLSLRERN